MMLNGVLQDVGHIIFLLHGFQLGVGVVHLWMKCCIIHSTKLGFS
jgi:hypothetical protein